jgi:hypothetical protein
MHSYEFISENGFKVGTTATHATDATDGGSSLAIFVNPTLATPTLKYQTAVVESVIPQTTTFATQGAGLYTIRGVAGLKTGATFKGTANQGYLIGVQGKLTLNGVVGDNASGGIYCAAGLFQMQNTGATYGTDAQLYGLWIDNQSGSANGPTLSHMVNVTNNGGTITNFFKLYGGNNVAQLFDIDTCGGMVAATATTSGTSKKIAIKIDGVQYYLNAYTG